MNAPAAATRHRRPPRETETTPSTPRAKLELKATRRGWGMGGLRDAAMMAPPVACAAACPGPRWNVASARASPPTDHAAWYRVAHKSWADGEARWVGVRRVASRSCATACPARGRRFPGRCSRRARQNRLKTRPPTGGFLGSRARPAPRWLTLASCTVVAGVVDESSRVAKYSSPIFLSPPTQPTCKKDAPARAAAGAAGAAGGARLRRGCAWRPQASVCRL